jgi:hypothetical protein
MASRRPKIVVLNHVLNHCAIGRVWPDGIEYTRFKHTNGMEASLGTGISYPSALAEAAQGSKTLNVLPQPLSRHTHLSALYQRCLSPWIWVGNSYVG